MEGALYQSACQLLAVALRFLPRQQTSVPLPVGAQQPNGNCWLACMDRAANWSREHRSRNLGQEDLPPTLCQRLSIQRANGRRGRGASTPGWMPRGGVCPPEGRDPFTVPSGPKRKRPLTWKSVDRGRPWLVDICISC